MFCFDPPDALYVQDLPFHSWLILWQTLRRVETFSFTSMKISPRFRSVALPCVLLTFPSLPAFAGTPAMGPTTPATSLQEEKSESFRIDFGALYEFGDTAAAGPSGEVFQSRVTVPFLVPLTESWRMLGLVTGGFSDYETDPFEGDGLQTWSVAALVTAEGQLTPEWSLTLGGIGSASWEDGASFSDSLNGGGLGLVSYRFSPTLKIGIGGLYLTRTNEDPLVIPALGLDWEPTENIKVTLYGLDLRAEYALTEDFSLYVRGEYDPGGALLKDRRNTEADSFDDQGFRAAGGVRWSVCRNFTLSLEGGVAFHEYTLRNENEEILAKDRIDPAPFVGMAGRLSF